MSDRDIDLGRRYFTNTYTTGEGRQNYLRIDNLEDPLFTSFTLDIDFVSSPLFYTINYSDYGYPNADAVSKNIETALEYMYMNDIADDGFDILPMLSASILDGNKLGFGLQQNVYADMPLYGATEYIYMVDKRNGGSDQNDARFDSNKFVDYGSNPNSLNSYKLGDSVKTIVNDSDKAWAENQKKKNENQISECDDILNDESVINEHKQNENELNDAFLEYNQSNKITVDGVEYTESGLLKKIEEYKGKNNSFEKLKKDIVDWVNVELSQFQNRGTNIYATNKCVQKIATYDDIAICGEDKKKVYKDELIKIYKDDFVKVYISGGNESYLNKFDKLYKELGENLLSIDSSGERGDVKTDKIINKFGDRLEYFGLYKKGESSITGKVQAISMKTNPDWFIKVNESLPVFVNESEKIKKSKNLMSFQCDSELSFIDFESDTVEKNDSEKIKYEDALDNLRTGLYGFENGSPCDVSNASKDSPYSKYLAAKEKYENDDYSQAEKAKSIAQSGASEMRNMLNDNEYVQSELDKKYNESIKNDTQPLIVNNQKTIVASQTVLDMLGFINGMRKMTQQYPYIIQGVSGLDTAYNKHYVVKDPYLGSGDDKITLTCFESLDLRVSSMFNRYFNAVYDRQYRRERVPVNLRRFNCSIYVHDVRNFVSILRLNKNGTFKKTYNRLLELTDMYYSVIEFRFFDCEIVPEETGNIFDSISNEAPSDMKKTNFTFTYGNCVVNFVPQSEVAKHNV